jgi:multidrug efflux pump subunit AcrB
LIFCRFFVKKGLTTMEVAQAPGVRRNSASKRVVGAFDGAPVSTFWEGDRSVTIPLRLTQPFRSSFSNVHDAYVNSPPTMARVPFRAISTLGPERQTSRIVRRNGLRTLTVRSFVALVFGCDEIGTITS